MVYGGLSPYGADSVYGGDGGGSGGDSGGFNGWAVTLNGVTFTTCHTQAEWDELQCSPGEVFDVLTDTPDGLSPPDRRNEDVTYPQRDGVKHFSDWYLPRYITVTGTFGPIDTTDCVDGDCYSVREQVLAAAQAWARGCCDTELVVYTDCYLSDHAQNYNPFDPDAEKTLVATNPPDTSFDGDTPTYYDPDLEGYFSFEWDGADSNKYFTPATFHGSVINGPFGVVGRPDKFYYKPRFRNDQIYDFTALFRAVDQRMYVLDECGTPGFEQCVTVNPGALVLSICPDVDGNFCPTPAGWCFTDPVESESVDPEVIAVGGTERVFPTITLFGPLANPRIENVTTGDFITYTGTIGELPVTINTEDGTAFDSEGTSLTHLLGGSLFLSMDPGNYEFRLLSADAPDEPGFATLCWRDTVVSA